MKKIAFPSDDGETISRHLGQAQFYIVALLDDGGAVTFERREKPRHERSPNTGHEEKDHHTHRGPAMFVPIQDCQVLISGGMGQPAYDFAVGQGLEVILSAQANIAEALNSYRDGTLVSDMRRVHKH